MTEYIAVLSKQFQLPSESSRYMRPVRKLNGFRTQIYVAETA